MVFGGVWHPRALTFLPPCVNFSGAESIRKAPMPIYRSIWRLFHRPEQSFSCLGLREKKPFDMLKKTVGKRNRQHALPRAQYPSGTDHRRHLKGPSSRGHTQGTPSHSSGFESALPSQPLRASTLRKSLAVGRTLPLGGLETTCLKPRKPPRCIPPKERTQSSLSGVFLLLRLDTTTPRFCIVCFALSLGLQMQ